MKKRAMGFVLLFIVVQLLGVTVPQLTNIHSRIWPAFGLVLLVPGIAVAAFFGLTKLTIAVAVLLNACAWYFLVPYFFRDSRRA